MDLDYECLNIFTLLPDQTFVSCCEVKSLHFSDKIQNVTCIVLPLFVMNIFWEIQWLITLRSCAETKYDSCQTCRNTGVKALLEQEPEPRSMSIPRPPTDKSKSKEFHIKSITIKNPDGKKCYMDFNNKDFIKFNNIYLCLTSFYFRNF